MTPNVLLFTLFSLFDEPREGKAQAKRLEEDERSHRNCRHVFFSPGWQGGHNTASFLADTAAVAAAAT